MENAAPNQEELRTAYGENVETRTMELRAADSDGDLMVLEGFAANFEQETDLGYFKEKIARGAFEGRMEDDVRYLLNHKGVPMARTSNGTLELEVREEGLYTRAVLNDTQQSKDVYKAVKRGDITSMSFAFTIAEDEIDVERNLRTVTKVKKLYDVSAVTYPAYPTTSIKARDAFSAKLEEAVVEAPTEPTPEVREEAKPEKSETRNFERKSPQKMNINDLKGQRAAYYEEFVALGDNADQEGRSMTEAEQERADRLNELIEDIDVKIRHKKREQEMVARQAHVGTTSTSEKRDIDKTNYRFSLSRALDAARQNKVLEGAEAEWMQEAHREMRHMGLSPAGAVAIPSFAMEVRNVADDFTADGAKAGGTAADGTGFVGVDVPGAIEALRQPSFIQSLGAQTINATGNLKFPRISTPASATNKAETTAAAASQLAMDEVNLNPLRATAETKYSKQLLIQGGAQVDAVIANDLRQALATHIDLKGFAEILADGSVDEQQGGTDTTYAATVAIAQEPQSSQQAVTSTVRSTWHHPPRTSWPNSGAGQQHQPLIENGRLNGYQLYATKHIADETAGSVGQQIFGNFRQGLIIALFGGLDILVDPYTAASTGQVKLHVNRFYDVAVRQPGAFSIATDLA